MRTRALALSAVMAALAAVFLILAAVLPTGQLGFVAAASVCGVIAVCEAGIGGGAAVFAVGGLLGLLLAPDKTPVLVYGVFFGWYPVLKLLAERAKSPVLQWIIKLAAMNAALTVLIFAFSVTFFDFGGIAGLTVSTYLIMNAAFILYDIGLTQLIGWYYKRFRKIR